MLVEDNVLPSLILSWSVALMLFWKRFCYAPNCAFALVGNHIYPAVKVCTAGAPPVLFTAGSFAVRCVSA